MRFLRMFLTIIIYDKPEISEYDMELVPVFGQVHRVLLKSFLRRKNDEAF